MADDVLQHLGGAGPHGVPGGKKERDRRAAYISAGVGAVGVLIAYLAYRKQASANAAGSSASGAYTYPTTTGSGTIGVAPSSAYSEDPAQGSYDQALLQSLQGIQSELSGTGTTSSSSTGTSSSTSSTPSGAYGSPIYGPTSGGSYVPITGGYSGVAADAAAGLPVYYQPAGPSGPWVEVPPQDIYPGSGYNSTAIFVPSTGPPMVQPAQPASGLGAMTAGPGVTMLPGGGRGGAGASSRAATPAGATVRGGLMPDAQLSPAEQLYHGAGAAAPAAAGPPWGGHRYQWFHARRRPYTATSPSLAGKR